MSMFIAIALTKSFQVMKVARAGEPAAGSLPIGARSGQANISRELVDRICLVYSPDGAMILSGSATHWKGFEWAL
jgi:hypothetical protein